MNQKGQSTIEAAITLTAIISAIMTITFAVYLVYASFWLEHYLHRSLICSQERSNIQLCKRDYLAKIKKTLIFTNNINLHLRKTRQQSIATLIWFVNPPFINPYQIKLTRHLKV